MKIFLSIFVAVCCMIYGSSGYGAGYENNFNSGDKLNGWKDNVHSWDGGGVWTVHDGRLVAVCRDAKKNAGLYYTAEKFYNFELMVDAVMFSKSPVVIPFRFVSPVQWYALYLVPGRRKDNLSFVLWLASGSKRFTGTISQGFAGIYFQPMKVYRVKLKAKDGEFFAKVWPANSTEPAEWNLKASDERINVPGYVGLSVQRAGNIFHAEFDNFRIDQEK